MTIFFILNTPKIRGVFQVLLWANRDQNEVRPWQLYEILRKTGEYFKLCCGQNRIGIRSARGSYMKEEMKFLFMEPFFGGSHKSFALGWQDHSRHEIELLTLPDRFWKWRMRASALQLLERKTNFDGYDGIITSDMINLADFIALAQKPPPPCLVYFHENQMSYPPLPGKKPDDSLGFINITTALAARRIVFNSRFHQKEFLSGVSEFLKKSQDGDMDTWHKRISGKSVVCYPGCQLPSHYIDPELRGTNPPLIIWNHRWAYDKNPSSFFKALKILKGRKIAFQLALLGEAGGSLPKAFHVARDFFKKELVCFGYVHSRKAYESLLARGDIVVSTAIQENFGISVVEAVANGCFPVLPHRLAYPEIIPAQFHDEVFYRNDNNLPDMLENILLNPRRFYDLRRALAKKMMPYAWTSVIEAYDTELDLLATR